MCVIACMWQLSVGGEATGVIVLTGVCQMGSAGCRAMGVGSLIIQHLLFKHLSAPLGEIGSC